MNYTTLFVISLLIFFFILLASKYLKPSQPVQTDDDFLDFSVIDCDDILADISEHTSF